MGPNAEITDTQTATDHRQRVSLLCDKHVTAAHGSSRLINGSCLQHEPLDLLLERYEVYSKCQTESFL